MVTVWSKKAQLQLLKAFDFIKQDSVQNAEKVRDEIIDVTIDLVNHPEKYSLDKYKQQTMEVTERSKSIAAGFHKG